jgi:predicted Zn-dependent protease
MKFIKDWGFSRDERRRGDSRREASAKAYRFAYPLGRIAPTIWRSRIERKIVTIIAVCLVCFISAQAVSSQPPDPGNLPPLKVHTLPQSLALWKQNNQGNYFDQIETTPLGYLVWSKFPLKVYVDSVAPENNAASQRFQEWTAAARKAIAEWNIYLPLQEVIVKDTADILVLRTTPERAVKLNLDTGLYDIPRAVAAQTNYKFYLTEDPVAIAFRMTMEVSPNFTGVSLLATIRHEFGHALGIWGHSPKSRDALYFSQVQDPPGISARDVNTLKKIYQQPTRLGVRSFREKA